MGSLIEQMLADINAVGYQKAEAGKKLLMARRHVDDLTREAEREYNEKFGVEEKRTLFNELMKKEAEMATKVNSKIALPLGALIDEYVAQNNLEKNDVNCKCGVRISAIRFGKPVICYNFKVKAKNSYDVFDFTRDENQVRFADGNGIHSHINYRPYSEYNGDEALYVVKDPRNIIFKVNYKELDLLRQNKPKIFKAMVAVLDRQLAETSERK